MEQRKNNCHMKNKIERMAWVDVGCQFKFKKNKLKRDALLGAIFVSMDFLWHAIC